MVFRDVQPIAELARSLAVDRLSFFAQDPVDKDCCSVRMGSLVEEHGGTRAGVDEGPDIFPLVEDLKF